MSPDVLVRQLRSFLDSVEEAAQATRGNVFQFAGSVSLVAWQPDLGAGGCNLDPIGMGRRVLEVVSRRAESERSPSEPRSLVCVGLAQGDCVYEEERGRVLSALGHAWLRVARDFQPNLGGDRDAVVLDRSVSDSLAPIDRVDVGDGWYRANEPRAE